MFKDKLIRMDGYRMLKGYKQGWLYHQVKDSPPMLECLIEMQNEGLIGRGYNINIYKNSSCINQDKVEKTLLEKIIRFLKF